MQLKEMLGKEHSEENSQMNLRPDTEAEEVLRTLAEDAHAPPEALSDALRLLDEQRARRSTRWGKFVRQIKQMDFKTRRAISSAFIGLQLGLVNALSLSFGDRYGLAVMGQILLVLAGLYNLSLSKTKELGTLVGAAFGASAVVGQAFFSALLRSQHGMDGTALIPGVLLGGLVGYLGGKYGERLLRIRFQQDPQARREYLLRQLIELQEELKKGERSATFLSVDVVGSTAIKQKSGALEVEYTFGEYVRFVSGTAAEFGGQVHSTAGDGVLLAFENPQDAFSSARRILARSLEFNSFRNRTGQPFELRCGIHTGTVVAPKGDASNVNYSEVIDISAHVQRLAPPGGIAITDSASIYLPGGPRAISSEVHTVQGQPARVWLPKANLTAQLSTGAAPPPPPSIS